MADSNQRRIYVKRNDAQTSCQTGTGRVHAFKSTPFSGDLGELENTANELGIPIIPHETAVFLDFIVGLYQPKNILEIGTAVGFSASLMATASPQAKVTTIDRYELMYSRAKANFERLGLADRITQLEGDAADILPTLEQGKYDFLFMDSAKAKYIEFFPYCMDVLEVGGVLMVDDIFQGERF